MSVRPSLHQPSLSIYLHRTSFGNEQTHPTCSAGCTLDHLHPPIKAERHNDKVLLWNRNAAHFPLSDALHVPFKSVFTFCPEEVHMGLKLQLEDVLLVDAVRLLRRADCVAEQRQARQWEVVLQHTCILRWQPSIKSLCADETNNNAGLTWWVL